MKKNIDLCYVGENGECEWAEIVEVEMTEKGFSIKRGGFDIFFPMHLLYPLNNDIADYEASMIIEKLYPEIYFCHEGATIEQMQEAYSYYQYVPIVPKWRR